VGGIATVIEAGAIRGIEDSWRISSESRILGFVESRLPMPTTPRPLAYPSARADSWIRGVEDSGIHGIEDLNLGASRLRRRAAAVQHESPPREALRLMGELAAKIVAAANRSFYDRDDLLKVARDIVAKSSTADAASLAWAVLSVIAQAQARQPPHARVTWRPSQIRRPQVTKYT
jgi:hypothetical protein